MEPAETVMRHPLVSEILDEHEKVQAAEQVAETLRQRRNKVIRRALVDEAIGAAALGRLTGISETHLSRIKQGLTTGWRPGQRTTDDDRT